MDNPFRKFSFRSQALVFDDYKGDYEIAQIYREMRDRAFALKPDEIGNKESPPQATEYLNEV